MRQVNQRVALRARLAPLSPMESLEYIEHRLLASGASELTQIMSPSAAWRIAEAAEGIKSVSNILADTVLIAGLGYLFQRDHSVGPAVVTALREQTWQAGVEIDDLSFGPIAVVQRFQDRPDHFGRVVLVSAVVRQREPGGIYGYRWGGCLPRPHLHPLAITRCTCLISHQCSQSPLHGIGGG